jgi:hypothetical protein
MLHLRRIGTAAISRQAFGKTRLLKILAAVSRSGGQFQGSDITSFRWEVA